jgi:hypothetical protein
MTGSSLVAIITPIVALIGLAFWLGMIFWAEGRPGWKTHNPAQESQFPGESITLASDLRGDQPATPPQERKAA